MQIFDRTKIILFVIIFPSGCTEFPENSMSFPGSENSLSIPGFSRFVSTLFQSFISVLIITMIIHALLFHCNIVNTELCSLTYYSLQCRADLTQIVVDNVTLHHTKQCDAMLHNTQGCTKFRNSWNWWKM